jgi:hypothetical protein
MDNLVNIILSPIAPLKTSLNVYLPRNTPLSSLPTHITNRLPFPNLSPKQLVIRHQSYLLPDSHLSLQSLQNVASDAIFLTLSLRLPGGKGGFGSQLRAQGGRMASRKKRGPQDKSAMRDLSGRRIKAVQQAKELADYIAKAPGLERKAREEKRRKLEAVLASNPAAAIKMDDHAYWEDKEKLVEGVKNAVREAVRGAKKDGGKVEVVHTVSVRGGGVKRDLKFAGFEEDYDDSSEDEQNGEEDDDIDEEVETEGEEEEGEEEAYEESTEEEDPKDIKGKGVARK